MSQTAEIMARVRALCESLPGVEAYLMHGHPSFRAGKKCFLIASEDPAERGFSVKVPVFAQPDYLEDPRITRTHYIGQHGWIDLHLDREPFSWEELERLVMISYRLAANKTMLKQLEAQLATS